jgi:hypothetical protein
MALQSRLFVSRLNRIENVQDRVEAMVELFASSDRWKAVVVDEPFAADGELWHRFSQAIISNPRIELVFFQCTQTPLQNLLPWIAAWDMLAHMTSLRMISIFDGGTSVKDWDFFFSLLLTSTSIQELVIIFRDGCHDAFFSSCARYLLNATTLRRLSMFDMNMTLLSEAAITSFCNGVAQSSLQELRLHFRASREANIKSVVDHAAQAIAQSSLEVVVVDSEVCLALSRTTPVRDLDFVFSWIEKYNGSVCHLQINRKWKHLLSANIPWGLWPRILHKAHASPEMSHGREGILFYFLRERADLVPGNSF